MKFKFLFWKLFIIFYKLIKNICSWQLPFRVQTLFQNLFTDCDSKIFVRFHHVDYISEFILKGKIKNTNFWILFINALKYLFWFFFNFKLEKDLIFYSILFTYFFQAWWHISLKNHFLKLAYNFVWSSKSFNHHKIIKTFI